MRYIVNGYSHTYPIGSSGHFEKAWAEVGFDEGDDIISNLIRIKQDIEKFHKESNPGAYITVTVEKVVDEITEGDLENAVKRASAQRKSQTEKIIDDLNTCRDIKVLESYSIIARNYPEIRDAYEKRMMELLQKEVGKESIIVAADNLCKNKKHTIKN